MRYLLFTFFIFCACVSQAQSILKDEKELKVLLDEVVVTGTGTEHYLKDAPVQTEVITKKALEQYQARSIDDLLGGLCPSLTFHDGDMGSHIQLNGLNNDYILIMVNGKRMNGDIGGQNDLNQLNLDNIERIEIVKGAASSLYGSDAIAGVINIITKQNKDKINVTNTTRVGAYGDIRQSNTIGFAKGGFSSTTSFNMRHTDGWRNTDLQWDQHQLKSGSTAKTVNRATNYTVSEDLTYQVNNRLQLSANGSFYQRWVMRPHGQWKYYANDYYYNNFDIAAGGKYRLTGRNFLTLDVSYGRYGYFYDFALDDFTDYFIDGKRVTYYAGNRIKQSVQKQVLTQLKGVFYFGDQHILNVGIEHQYDHLESPHRISGNAASVYTLAAYAQEEWTITENFNLTAGARATLHKEFGMKLSPKVSAMYKLGDFNLRGTYSLGFKAPTIKELYYDYVGTMMSKLKAYYGNKDLKPQTSQYVSVGLEYSSPKFKASITGYYNRIRNMIALTNIPTSSEDKFLEVEESKKYNNLSKARIYGADFTFTYQPIPSLTFGGGYSYTDPKALYVDDEDDPHYMQYTPIDATSYHNATLNATWQHVWKRYRLGLGIYGKYQSTRHYISDNDADGYNLWRLNTAHSLLKVKHWDLTMNAGIDNIFDYVDRTPFGRNRGTTTPGRTYYVSIVAKFQNKK